MFASIVLTTVIASRALLSRAIVTPNDPAPGDTFNEGTTCHVGWAGDADSGSTTAWLNMAIELMTGPNEAMIHVTTVATGQDGTKDGTFDYTCPAVNPNSPIYFYQFTAPGTANYTWTGRFTIAGTDGSSTPATETEIGGDGQTVHWGTGALVDASSAVPPPTFNSTSNSNSASSTSSQATTSSSSPTSSPTSKTGSVSPLSTSGTSSSPSGLPQPSGSNAAVAVGPMSFDTRMWPIAVALFASAMGFTMFL
ncbi:hypothetical protein C8F01DRAFT_1124857 [Mycena amicta]|nr:hypothetical protein C8F01DRAFT_1124857 [Mycena amicta]